MTALRPIVLGLLLAPAAATAGEPIVIAHRGASGYLPEHTLEAVVLAHAQGADFIEQDVVLSKDRVPVVLHDVELDAVTDVARKFPGRQRPDGRFYAIDFTLDELKTLHVRERIDPRTGQAAFPGRFPIGKGTFRIPTLAEELDLIAGLNATTGRRAGIYPEIKAPAWHREQGYDISPIVLETLAQHGYSTPDDPCYLQCFDIEEVRRIREELGYRGKLVQLLAGRRGSDNPDPTSPENLKALAKRVDGIGPAWPMVVRPAADGSLVRTELLSQARAAGLLVHPYTFRVDALPTGVSAEALLRTLFDGEGVDGLFADQPDHVVSFLRSRSATSGR